MKKLLPLFLIGFILSIQTLKSQEIKPKIWLRADQIDKKVNYWPDVSGNKNHALAADNFVLSINELINFNKAISFDGIDDKLKIPFDLSMLSQLTIISVYHSKETKIERSLWSANVNVDQDVMLTTQKIKSPQNIVRYSEGNMKFPVINTTTQSWGKSENIVLNQSITLGSGGTNESSIQPFLGNLAEYMVFDRVVGGTELQIIQSYLSIKYGTPLLYSNYIDSKGDLIWDFKNNESYSYSVTGIGRDDALSLYQKQSYNTGNPDFMVIANGNIAESNDANTSLIGKNEFLLWGDNGKGMTLERVTADIYPYKFPVLDRKWLMSATGNSVSNLSTELKINVNGLLNSQAQCYLVIDRTGTGDFSSPDIEYIAAKSITDDGYAWFDNIHWDTDKSGSDIFTFSFGMDNGVTCISPNCFNESNAAINIEVQGGFPPYSFVLKNDSVSFEKTWNSPSRKHRIDNLSVGAYFLKVMDSANNSAVNTVRINNPENLSLGLDYNYSIQLGEYIELDAGLYIQDPAAVFVWEGNNGFYSTDRNVTLFDPGAYTVSVTNSTGCKANGTFTVAAHENVFYSYKLYPNPSNGNINVAISLAGKSDVSIRIFNSQGVLISEKQVSQVSGHRYSDYLSQTGIYLVEIETSYGKEIFKLIVD